MEAIGIHLEAPGESLEFFLPYEQQDDGTYQFHEAFFGPAEAEVFATP